MIQLLTREYPGPCLYSPEYWRGLSALAVLLLLVGCGGGGGTAAQPEALQAAVAALSQQQVKTFSFSWSDAKAATHYRLLENPDGVSGYTQVGADIPAGVESFAMEVPLCHRLQASYILQSCDADNCLDAAPLQITDALADSVGYFKASNSGLTDQFGFAVALSADGNTMVVAAPSEDSAAAGINGDASDNSLPASGAVYVFDRTQLGWQQSAYLKAGNPDSGDFFGYALDISADGTTIAAAAHFESSNASVIDGDGANNLASEAGAVYVFQNNAGSWLQQAYIKAPNSEAGDRFGWSLSLSSSGDRLAVSAPGEDSAETGVGGSGTNNGAAESGAAYLFERVAGSWSYTGFFKASNTDAGDSAGFSVSLSGDGTVLAFGAHGEASAGSGASANPADNSAAFAGAVYVFRENAGSWSQQAYLKSSNTDSLDRFGWSVSLDGSGTVLAVGTYAEESTAQGIDGDQLDNSAADAGAVYLFEYDSLQWVQQHYIKAPNSEALDLFGFSTRISADGNTLLVGAYGESAVAAGVFESGSAESSDNSAPDAGAAYLYARENGNWQPFRYLKPPNPDANDLFGWSLDLSADGTAIAVGAQREASAANTIAGDADDNSADDAGAVYLY